MCLEQSYLKLDCLVTLSFLENYNVAQAKGFGDFGIIW